MEGVKLLQEADFYIGHNVIWFDLVVLNKLMDAKIDPYRSIDTLVCSRLLNSWDYSRHGLEDWGERLGFPKTDFKAFDVLTEIMVEYCINDVELNFRVWEFMKSYIFHDTFKGPLRLEHDTAIMYREMHENGFAFDKAKALDIRQQIEHERTEIDKTLSSAFPPKAKIIGNIKPKSTKKGGISMVNFKWLDGVPEDKGYAADAEFTRIEWEAFNPASPKQCIERLNEAGWQPYEKTKGHIKAEKERDREKLENYKKYGWTISEANLETLPETAPPAARSLVRWILLNRRILTLDEWLGAYNEQTGRIHGEVRHIGTWTHRASHKNPNTGNITRVNSDPATGETLWGEKGGWGADYRSMWKAADGYKLVGCDADGIQLRVLAHYMEDEAFTQALVAGSSKDGTDAHTLNWKALGEYCRDRNVAKTFIYAWLLGAGLGKVAQILSCTPAQAGISVKSFISKYPGLKRLKEEIIPDDAERGFFTGFDGRPVMCNSEHLMLAGYLQNGENLIMKTANRIWQGEVKKLRIPFKQVNMVHDEFQTEVLDQDDMPEIVGKIQAQSIVQAGIDLGVKCPQAGNYKIGLNWYETH